MRPQALALFLGLALAATLRLDVAAQDLKYTSTTTMEMGGALGSMMSMMGGAGDPTVETTYISGTRVRKDQGQSSSIFDWQEGVITLLDHRERTFTRFTLAEMAAQMSAAMSQAGAGAPPTPNAAERPEVEIEVKFSSERTGRTERIAGYQAEQVILVTEVIATPTASAQPDQESVGMAVVSELWMSTDFPEYAMMREMAAEAAAEFREAASAGMAGAMAGMAAFDPRMSEVWTKNMEAVQEVEGVALRTRMHFVTIPPGVILDRQDVLDQAGQPLGGGGGAGGGAAEAMRQALGGLGGLAGRFGGGQQAPQPEPAQAELAQSVFMRMTTEVSGTDTGTVSGDLFQAPPGYTERAMGNPFGG